MSSEGKQPSVTEELSPQCDEGLSPLSPTPVIHDRTMSLDCWNNSPKHSSQIFQSDLYLLSGLNYSGLSDRETNLLQQSYCGLLSHRVFSLAIMPPYGLFQ